MRYVPINRVEPGMELGRDVFNGEGRLVLVKRTKMTPEYISGLLTQGYFGIYIEDELSEDICINQVVRPEVQREALKIVNDLFLNETDLTTSQKEIQETIMKIVNDVLADRDTMCNMIDLKAYDDYTYFHSVNVSVISVIIGVGLGMKEEELKTLTTAALLHDIGNRVIANEIINAPRKLTDLEMREIYAHPAHGYDIIKGAFNFSANVYTSILQHHESYDGTGYPLQRKGEDIPIYARIIKVVDVYDAMTSKRPYHDAFLPSEAVEYIMGGAGVLFDPKVVAVFLKKVAAYPVGVEVELSDGQRAIVVKNYQESVLRPLVRIIDTKEELDLKSDVNARNITITKMYI